MAGGIRAWLDSWPLSNDAMPDHMSLLSINSLPSIMSQPTMEFLKCLNPREAYHLQWSGSPDLNKPNSVT